MLPVAGAEHLLIGGPRLMVVVHRSLRSRQRLNEAFGDTGQRGRALPLLLSSDIGAATVQLFDAPSPEASLGTPDSGIVCARRPVPATCTTLRVVVDGSFAVGFAAPCCCHAVDWSANRGIGSVAGDSSSISLCSSEEVCQAALLNVCRRPVHDDGDAHADDPRSPPSASVARGAAATYENVEEPLGWIHNEPEMVLASKEDRNHSEPGSLGAEGVRDGACDPEGVRDGARVLESVCEGDGLYVVMSRCGAHGQAPQHCRLRVGDALPVGALLRVYLEPRRASTGCSDAGVSAAARSVEGPRFCASLQRRLSGSDACVAPSTPWVDVIAATGDSPVIIRSSAYCTDSIGLGGPNMHRHTDASIRAAAEPIALLTVTPTCCIQVEGAV